MAVNKKNIHILNFTEEEAKDLSAASKVEVPNGYGYSSEDRKYACFMYMMHGSGNKVHKITGIPQRTVNDWMNTGWWEELVSDYRDTFQQYLDSKFTAIIHEATDHIMDRIQNGEEVLDVKTGNRYRRKMTGRDLTMNLAILFDKRQIMRNSPTSISQSAGSTLDELAERFEKAVKKSKDKAEGKTADEVFTPVESRTEAHSPKKH